MLGSNHPNQTPATQEKTIRRRRYQKGSLQARKHGKKRVWIVQYYDADGHHRYRTLGRMAELTKSQAQEQQVAFMRTINGGEGEPQEVRPVLVSEFVNQVYLPFQRGKWKKSTKGTSENRIQFHIVRDLGNRQLEGFGPTELQAYLDEKATTHGFSMVDHLRWDLTSICDLAVAEKVLTTNPAKKLYTPSTAKKGACPVMTASDVEIALGAVESREKVILHMAIFSGLRPGEILAIRRRNVAMDGRYVQIEQRVYRGDLGTPKNSETRRVAVPPRTAALLVDWLRAAVGPEPDAWVFASENSETPLWRDNLLRRHIRTPLQQVGLGWVDFKVMRHTNASLGQVAKVAPKVSAAQRGHGIGVSLDVYTKSNLQQKGVAAKKLEDSIYRRKVLPMEKRQAS